MIKLKIQENKQIKIKKLNEDVEPDLKSRFPNPDDQLLLRQLPKDATSNPVIKTFLRAGYIPVIGANLNSVVFGSGEQGIVIEVVKDGKRYAGKVASFDNEHGHDPFVEREVRKKIEEIRPSLPPEVSKHIIKCYAIFNDKDNLYYVMDIVRPLNRQESEALFHGLNAAQPMQNKRNFPKGWPTKKDPYEMNHIRGDFADDTQFPWSYTPFANKEIEKAFPQQASFIKAMVYLGEHFGIKWNDLHHKNVMINPKTGDYVATDIGLFYIDKNHKQKQPNQATKKTVNSPVKGIKPVTQPVGKTTKNEKPIVKEQLLQEIRVEDVLKTIDSKATRKVLFNLYSHLVSLPYEKISKLEPHAKEAVLTAINDSVDSAIKILPKVIKNIIPYDLDDSQKGLSANWIKRTLLTNSDLANEYLFRNTWGHNYSNTIKTNLETYFKIHRFIEDPYQDLMKVPDQETLSDLTYTHDGGSPAVQRFRKWTEERDYNDAEQGTETIYEDENWKIFIPHNKGAACQLGKGTQWCTAAPGLEYYAHYHKPEDPLFIIWHFVKSEHDVINMIPIKYQFHYGSGQFMDANDVPIFEEENGLETFKTIHRLLVKTVADRYPFLKELYETSEGISKKEVLMDRVFDNDEHATKKEIIKKITYKDLISGLNDNPPDKPNIGWDFYDQTIWLSWDKPREYDDRYGSKTKDSGKYREDGPAFISFIYPEGEPENIKVNRLTWNLQSGLVARLRSKAIPHSLGQTGAFEHSNSIEWNGQSNETIEDNMILWETYFQRDYEQNIEPDIHKWGLEQLYKYLPSEMIQQIGLPAQISVTKEPLKENLLTEITVEQALNVLDSKATRKTIFNLIKQEFAELRSQRIVGYEDPNKIPSDDAIKNRMEQLKRYIRFTVPEDIDEKQKALVIIWLKNYFLNSYKNYYNAFVTSNFREVQGVLKYDLERFFQWNRFIEQPEKRDLNSIKSFDELDSIVSKTRPLFKAWQEKQLSLDADKGTEFLGENEYFKVYAAHNKGAACELGKGTDWCTAAPGLEYFSQYYQPHDPLFIFIAKVDTKKIADDLGFLRWRTKFQFHYGSQQFMDEHDKSVNRKEFDYLDTLLYSILKEKHLTQKYYVVGDFNNSIFGQR